MINKEGSLTTRRKIKTMKQQMDVIKNSITEKAKFPGGVSYFLSLTLA